MSLQFSDSTNKNGIVELTYSILDADSTKYPIEEVTRDVNLALDKFMSIAIPSSGTWQFDDSNHLKDPIITTNLVSGQRDYHFTVDEQSNLILDIYRVMVKNPDGIFYDLVCSDQQSKPNWAAMPVSAVNYSVGNTMVDGQNRTGNPTHYDKTANGIFLDLIPDYNSDGGLKMWYNREANYFLKTDTNKKPGVPGLFHEYFALRPAMQYAQRKGLKILGNGNRSTNPGLLGQVQDMEQAIADYFGQRIKDERPVFYQKKFNYK